MTQLFLDMDGVLADFSTYYHARFGEIDRNEYDTPDRWENPPGLWDNIRSVPNFYRELLPMPDARELWDGVRHLNPTVLTGVPFHQVPAAEEQKRAWVAEHLGTDVKVICCRSRDKRLHAKAGDVLVDDWTKYRHLWVEMGGVFVLHTSASESLRQLKELGVL